MPGQTSALPKAPHFQTWYHDKNQISLLVSTWERFPLLLRNPQTTRMLGDVEVQNAPAIMRDHKEAIQHTEPESWDREEVHGRNRLTMVV